MRLRGLVVLAVICLLACGTMQAQTPDQVGQWGPVLDWGVQGKHMVMLPTDKVLVWSTGDTARVWNPATGTFTLTPAVFGDLHCAGQAALADGRVIVIGGQNGSPHVGTTVTALFDPFTNTWTQGAAMHYQRWYATATTLPDGRLLATSGDDANGTRMTIPEIYDPVTNTWTELTGANRAQGLYPFMFVLPNGKIYEAGTSTGTWVLDTSGTGGWTTGPTNGFGSSGYAESGAMYGIGKIIRSGGGDPAIARAAAIDMTASSPAWEELTPMNYPRRRHNLVILADGTVMAVGGTRRADDESQAVLQNEIWDPTSKTWTVVASLAEARMYHSAAVLMTDGRVVAAGGEASGRLRAQVYEPPYLFKGARPTITSAPDAARYSSTFTVVTPDASSIVSVALIRSGAATHAFNHNQRYVPLAFTVNATTGNLDVTSPDNGNIAPPGYYMLVLKSGNGVPSIATWIRIDSNIAAATVSGHVTDSSTGNAVEGAIVAYSRGSTTTDAGGAYTLNNVAPGDEVFTVSASGFGTVTKSQTISAGANVTLNFSLSATGRILGTVTDSATSQGLANVTISYNGGTTTTDSNGAYVISGIAAGSQTVIASLTGYQSLEKNTTVSPGADSELDFALVKSSTFIAGQVIDAATEEPLAGATVSYSLGSATTNASGVYKLDNTPPGTYTVTASAAGHTSVSQSVIVTAGIYSTADFALPLKGRIVGTVTDSATGQPLANATVNCSCGSTATDASGNYAIGNVDAGSYTVTASASGYLSQQKSATVSAGNDAPLAFALVKTATSISGEVTDAASGLAISGATVSYSLVSTTTNASGAYQLDNVAPGTYTLTASASGYSSVSQSVVVTAGTPATANFSLPLKGRIVGTLTDSATGQSLANATVNCSCGSATTDTNGSYTLGNIDAGSYTVTASASGYLSQQKNATVSAGNDTTLAFALVKTATYIGGQVTDAASGLAISGATVSFSLGSTTTNATGAYQLDNVPPGTYTLTASASGYSSVNQNVVVTAGTPATANFALPVLPPPPPPPPPTRIKDITLEDGSLTNPSSGADAVQGSVSLNSATPLKQVYSANVTAGSSFVDESFTAASDFYLSFYFRLNAIPTSDVRLVQITNAGTTTVKVQVKTTGRLRLVAGSTTIGETSNSLTVGQVYRLGIHQKAGTGANAVAEAFLAVGDQEFGTPFATSANGTWKTSADRVRVGATTSTPVNVVLDDLRLDSGSMPPPSGTPPPPGAAPSADFKATPTSGTAPLTVQFQDLSTGNPTSWAWDFQNDGQVDSTSQNPQFTYTASGTYTVKMTTSNAQGSSSATKTALITVQNAAPVSTLTFAPVADAHVKSTSASSNYGTNTSLQIRQGDASNNTTYRAYLKFTVSGLTGPVTSAKLRLYVSDASAQLTTVSATTTSWTETGLTWNYAPAPGAFLASGGPPKLGWLEIPLPTSAFGLGNGTYALVLTDGGTDSAIFNSREGANPPQLVLSQ